MTVFNDYTIQDCCEILNNKRSPLNSEERDTIKGQYPYYGANGIQGYIDKYMLDGKLILMAEDGGYFDEYATKPIAYQVEGKCWVNNHAHVLKAKEGFEQDYIFYSLVHKNITPVIKGGTRSKLNLSELKQIVLPLPPIPIQQKIAKILSTIDGQIEKTEAIIAKYQAVKQGMLQDLFTRGIDVTTGELRPKYEDAPELYKDSPLGMIPREWEVGRLDKYMGFLKSGLSRLLSEEDLGIPVLISGNIQDNKLTFSSLKYWYIKDPQGANTKSYVLDKGDILLCFINSVDQIGKAAIFEGYFRDCIYTTNLFRIKASQSTMPKFLYYLVCSNIVQNEINAIVKPAVHQASFTTKEFSKIPVPLISSDEQKQLLEKLSKIDQMIKAEQNNSQKINKIKQGLMSDLLSGKVAIIA